MKERLDVLLVKRNLAESKAFVSKYGNVLAILFFNSEYSFSSDIASIGKKI